MTAADDVRGILGPPQPDPPVTVTFVPAFRWCGLVDGPHPDPGPTAHTWLITPGDEPGPDAMRWTPDMADEEIAAWQKMLRPTPDYAPDDA